MAKIIFPGEFVLGLKPQLGLEDSIQETILDSKEQDIGLIVDDVGFKQRWEYFHLFGEDGVIALYDDWKKEYKIKQCNHLTCGLSEGPSITEDDIDFSQYEKIKGLSYEDAREKLVEDFLQKYDLKAKIFYETDLVKHAFDKTRKKGGIKKWIESSQYVKGERDELGLQFVKQKSGKPTCQGIYLALFEILADKGYEKVKLNFTQSMEGSMIAGKKNYNYLIKKSKGYEFKPIKIDYKIFGG